MNDNYAVINGKRIKLTDEQVNMLGIEVEKKRRNPFKRVNNDNTDICVVSNALMLKAAMPEIQIVVDSSCCAGTTQKMHEEALDIMRSCQIDVI